MSGSWNVGLEAADPEAQACELAVPGFGSAWHYLGGIAPAFYFHGGYLPMAGAQRTDRPWARITDH